jgi:hypothetical protein
MFLISRLWLVNVLDEVVDGGFLAHMAPLRGSARSGNLIAGDGMKNGFPAPNKELSAKHKEPSADRLPSHRGKAP